MTDAPKDQPAVLFLCVHNAGRSQMAAGWMRHLAGDAVEVYPGGSEPAAQVNPAAVDKHGRGRDRHRLGGSPALDGRGARAADVIVTMGCGDACPVYPGKHYEDWELDDPAAQPVEVVRAIRDDIAARVRHLLASLGISVQK
jgi:arsenate reductase